MNESDSEYYCRRQRNTPRCHAGQWPSRTMSASRLAWFQPYCRRAIYGNDVAIGRDRRCARSRARPDRCAAQNRLRLWSGIVLAECLLPGSTPECSARFPVPRPFRLPPSTFRRGETKHEESPQPGAHGNGEPAIRVHRKNRCGEKARHDPFSRNTQCGGIVFQVTQTLMRGLD
jgi:hypothetical protein